MHKELYARIGSAIRKSRDNIGMTQADLAEKTGLSRTSVTNIERGGQAIFVHQLLDVAHILGVAPSTLLPTRSSVERTDADKQPVAEEIRDLLKRLENPNSKIRSR